jgi:parvulin-like peptidyl-prolyl isomerase
MEAVCQLESGEISPVVQTPMGYHIIQLMDRRQIQSPPTQAQIMELASMELESALQEVILVELIDELRASHAVNAWPERLLNHL